LVNRDGKVLGCCRNFWGDFGGNAFQDAFADSLNSKKMARARAMRPVAMGAAVIAAGRPIRVRAAIRLCG
jgi:hypothetical protein